MGTAPTPDEANKNAPQGNEQPLHVLQQPDTPADAPQANTGPDNQPADDHTARPDREAAKYRREAREAQARADELAEQVADFQRAQVERALLEGVKLSRPIIHGSAQATTITGVGAQPAFLEAAGYKMSDLIGENHKVDSAKVAAALQDACNRFGVWPDNPAVMSSSPREGMQRDYERTSNSLIDAFTPEDVRQG